MPQSTALCPPSSREDQQQQQDDTMYKQFCQVNPVVNGVSEGRHSILGRCEAAWAAQDTTAAREVDKLWSRIDDWLLQQRQESATQGRSPTRGSSSLETTTTERRMKWVTASVFVSSTREDFVEERRRLAEGVFPELRDWCETRRIALRDLDLQRGGGDAVNADELAVAGLELLNACRAETRGRGAFFLGLVGNRFGWAPTEEQLTPELTQRHAWVHGSSSSQMEALHGALACPESSSPNAIFMLRCSATDDSLSTKLADDFAEPPGSLAAAHVARHRLEIVRRVPSEQMVAYTAPLAFGADQEQFEEPILAFFKRVIAEQYPDRASIDSIGDFVDLDEIGESNDVHIDYMMSLVGKATGQDRCLGLLNNFVETGELSMSDFRLFGDSADHIAFGLPGVKSVVISGDAGAGKSTMLARLGAQFLDRKGFEVLAHFAQFTPASNNRRTLQRKMKTFLKSLLPHADSARVGDDTSVSDLFNSIMKLRGTILILIDAFECFYEVSHIGELLPVAWPQNVRCVVSCRRKDLDRCFSERSVCLYDLERLDAEAQAAVCRNLLGSEPTNAGLVSSLLARPCAANPLWLGQACAEIRRFHTPADSDAAADTAVAEQLPGDARSLIRRIAERVIAPPERGGHRDGPVAAALLALVCVARVGLWERHARRLLRFAAVQQQHSSNGHRSDDVIQTDCDDDEELPLTEYLRVLRSTEPFLRPIARESAAVAFRHELARCAVQDLLLDSPELAKRWHSLAAQFILARSRHGQPRGDTMPVDPCLARDLPYHLYWSDRRSELHAILQGFAPDIQRQFGQRISPLTASGVYSSWRCRVTKVADKSLQACLVACSQCSARPGRLGHPRCQCCIYCGQVLSPSATATQPSSLTTTSGGSTSRPGSAVTATTCLQHLPKCGDEAPTCWFCRRPCDVAVSIAAAAAAAAATAAAVPLQVCGLCNAAASSYLCYQPVLETDPQFAQTVRNQTKKFGLQW